MGRCLKATLVRIMSCVAYLGITVYTKLDIGKQVELNGECIRMELPAAPEALIEYEGFLISGTCDWAKIFFNNKPETEGDMVIINIEDKSYRKIALKEFPSGVEFRPHGVYLLRE